jgi:hypothetical protein
MNYKSLFFPENKYIFTHLLRMIGYNRLLMKHYFVIIAVLLFVFPLEAQQAKQDVIATAGGFNSTSGVSVSWTLGETIVPTYSSPNTILTQGFQQLITVKTIEENLELQVTISLYPNPTSDVIKIVFDKPVEEEVQVCLFNSAGSIVKTDFIEPLMLEKQIGLQDLTSGIYILRLIRGNLTNVYKVVKL